MKADEDYDLVVVGTGFASTFFLHRFLAHAARPMRVLVLEAGKLRTHAQRMAEGDPQLDAERQRAAVAEQIVNRNPRKQWLFETAFGGGSNCWHGCTPRLLPVDFRLWSTYGVGADWPLTYDDLEPYYCDAEDLMNIAGDSDDTPCYRSRPYPQRPHLWSLPDHRLKAAFPDKVFSHPTAKSRDGVPGQRPGCCNSGVCRLCPIDAKFTISNAMANVYESPGVTLRFQARVTHFDYVGNDVRSVTYSNGDQEFTVAADLVVLGANAMFNPHIMLRSGLDDSQLGVGLCEQVSRSAYIELDGIDNYQGTTVSNVLGYMCYDGPHRSTRAAALVQSVNRPMLLNIRGRWLQSLRLNFIYEDYRLQGNRVRPSVQRPELPEVTHVDRSEQTERGLAGMEEDLLTILTALPYKSYELGEPWDTDSHIMGTTVMGSDPATSVIDKGCVHHRLRNLVVLGSGAFPTAAPANPTLTIAALSLFAAERLVGASAS